MDADRPQQTSDEQVRFTKPFRTVRTVNIPEKVRFFIQVDSEMNFVIFFIILITFVKSQWQSNEESKADQERKQKSKFETNFSMSILYGPYCLSSTINI